jgi:Tfp pilus assembly protein PilO
MNIITPIILILISFTAFFGYVNPNYRGENLSNGNRSIKNLQAEYAEYQTALNNSNQIRAKRQALMEKRGEINPEDLQKLEKLLPDNIDNIKLVINMNQIAQKHTLVLKNLKLDTAVKTDTPNKLGSDNNKYGTVGLSFSVSSSYDNFQNFLNDLEKSLRLVDITDLSITGNDSGVFDFSVGMKTYWLK